MRELAKGELTIDKIARLQKVTPRRVRQLREHEEKNGEQFKLQTERNAVKRIITTEEEQYILEARKKYPLGATMLEDLIERDFKKHIPHNLIQRVLNEKGFGMPLDKKIRRKDWVRYERKHSNSMWHADWAILNGKWFIVYEDDASRKGISWGEFDEATTEHSIEVLKKGLETYGKPREILTGRDIQFYASEAEGKKQGKNRFQFFLKEQGIGHILGRVNHPQTNGKEERLIGTIKQKRKFFKSLDELMHWYNYVKPHLSLNYEELETPAQAFVRKLHHKHRKEIGAKVKMYEKL
jgi:putative transposase